MPRTEPYTPRGVRRIKCTRPGCGKPGHAQWNACAENLPSGKQVFRVLCEECDVGLNEAAMRFIYGSTPEVEAKLKAYRDKVLGPGPL